MAQDTRPRLMETGCGISAPVMFGDLQFKENCCHSQGESQRRSLTMENHLKQDKRNVLLPRNVTTPTTSSYETGHIQTIPPRSSRHVQVKGNDMAVDEGTFKLTSFSNIKLESQPVEENQAMETPTPMDVDDDNDMKETTPPEVYNESMADNDMMKLISRFKLLTLGDQSSAEEENTRLDEDVPCSSKTVQPLPVQDSDAVEAAYDPPPAPVCLSNVRKSNSIEISPVDVISLKGKNWLSGGIIDGYLALIVDWKNSSGGSIYHLLVDEMTSIIDGNDFYKKLKLSDHEMVVGVYHERNCHWILIVIEPQKRSLFIYNPAGESVDLKRKAIEGWRNFIKKMSESDASEDIQLHFVFKEHFIQRDDYNCGVLCLLFAEKHMAGQPVPPPTATVTEEEFDQIRREIAKRIYPDYGRIFQDDRYGKMYKQLAQRP